MLMSPLQGRTPLLSKRQSGVCSVCLRLCKHICWLTHHVTSVICLQQMHLHRVILIHRTLPLFMVIYPKENKPFNLTLRCFLDSFIQFFLLKKVSFQETSQLQTKPRLQKSQFKKNSFWEVWKNAWLCFAGSKCRALAVQYLNCHGKKSNYIKTSAGKRY